MNKEFVSYTQSIALKELGFDEASFGHYRTYGKNLFYATPIARNLPARYRVINAPLYQQAFRWFREKHNLFCEIQMDRTTEPKFCFVIFKYEYFGNYEKVEVDDWYLYRTYEESESACLDKLIEICKNK